MPSFISKNSYCADLLEILKEIVSYGKSLSKGFLQEADLSEADLSDADLKNAELIRASLSGFVSHLSTYVKAQSIAIFQGGEMKASDQSPNRRFILSSDLDLICFPLLCKSGVSK